MDVHGVRRGAQAARVAQAVRAEAPACAAHVVALRVVALHVVAPRDAAQLRAHAHAHGRARKPPRSRW